MSTTQRNMHSRRKAKPLSNRFLIQTGAVGVVLVLVLYFGVQKPSGHVSPEVGFTDPSPSGLAILPASGASNPCPEVLNYYDNSGNGFYGSGYKLPNQVSQALVSNVYNANGQNSSAGSGSQTVQFCVSNGGQYYYFVPASTTIEIGDFYNAASSGSLPGTSVSCPGAGYDCSP